MLTHAEHNPLIPFTIIATLIGTIIYFDPIEGAAIPELSRQLSKLRTWQAAPDFANYHSAVEFLAGENSVR